MQEISKRIYRIKFLISSFISKYPIYKGVLILGSGTLFAQLVSVLTMPIITRLYTPSDFGVLATYVSILSVFSVAASFTFNIGLVLPKDMEEATSLFWLCIISLIITSIGFSIIIPLSGDFLIKYFHLDTIEKYSLLLVVGFIGCGLYQVLNYWVLRNRDYKLVTYTKINQSISSAFCTIFLGIFAFGPLGLIIGYVISQIFGTETLAKRIYKNDWSELNKVKLNHIRTTARKYYTFPLYNLPGTIINSLSFQIPVFMLLAAYDTRTVGLYSLAYDLMVLPGSFISSSISQAFLGDASKMLRYGNLELRSFYISTVRHISIITIPLIGLISLSAPIIIPYFFGEVWIEAGYYCLPLALVVIPNFIFSPTSKLSIYGYNFWSFIWNVMRTGSVLLGFYISHKLMFSVLTSLTIYGMIMLLMYLVNFWLNLKAISNLTNKMSNEKL